LDAITYFNTGTWFCGVMKIDTKRQYSLSEKLLLSGDNIIPLAMGGEFPAYTITELTGEITPQTISCEMMCGTYPLTFSGIIVGE